MQSNQRRDNGPAVQSTKFHAGNGELSVENLFELRVALGTFCDGAKRAKPDDAQILTRRMEHLVQSERFGSWNDLGANLWVYVTVESRADVADKILRKRFVGFCGEEAERQFHKIARRETGFADGIPK